MASVLLVSLRQSHADATSSTGLVTVEIVPPGGLNFNSGDDRPPVGTLSASIMLPPDLDGLGDNGTLEAFFVVEDHRAQECGWTVRLQEDSLNPARLVGVDVGGSGFGPPAWAYEGVQGLDLDAGQSIDNLPQLARATHQNRGGCGLTVSRMTLQVNHDARTDERTFVLFLPTAP